MAAKISAKRRFMLFLIIPLLVILIAGGLAFIISMKNAVNSGKAGDLRRVLEIERIKLETSMNGEIAIVLRMAASPLIQHYFENPSDANLEKMAFEEFAEYRKAFAGNSVFWINDMDKKFYLDDSCAFILDADDPAHYWYPMTLHKTEKYNININYNPNLDNNNLWINAPVFNKKGKPIGMLGTSVDVVSFVETLYRDYSESAALYFFNSSGEITGASNADVVVDKKSISELLEKTGERIFKHTENLSDGQAHSFVTNDGVVAIGTVPVLDWYIALIQPIDATDYMKTDLIVVFIAMVIMAALVLIFFNVLT